MEISNSEVAAFLYELADLLEAQGDNPYRIRAYRRAARIVNSLSKEIHVLLAEEYDLTNIAGIGDNLAFKIKEIVRNKTLPGVKHFPPQAVTAFKPSKSFYRLYHMMPIVDAFLLHMKSFNGVHEIVCAGDYRRRTEILHNLSFVVITSDKKNLIQHIISYHGIKEFMVKKSNQVAVCFKVGIQAQIYMVTNSGFAAALIYNTGSAAHYEQLKMMAEKKGLVLKQTGIYQDNKRLQSKTEHDFYQILNLSFIAPELRENRGEISAAENHTLPNLIDLSDIKGDLHSHTNETDGRETLEIMVHAAMEKGYEYLAITDHSQNLKITNGLDKKRLWQQIKLIDRLNGKLNGFVILKSIEMDILKDGSLDLPDDILKELDFTVCSIHSYFRLPLAEQTTRILRAMDNPYFTILGHATGRLIRRRDPYQLDMEKIIKAAKDRNCFLELNAQPYRLDIHDEYALMAKKMGVKLSISSDAHSTYELNYMKYGVYQARRGWIEANDVINTRSLAEFKKIIKR